VWRAWRAIADEYDPPRVFVGEIPLVRPDRLALYLRPDELHTAFNFDFMKAGFEGRAIREAVTGQLEALRAVGAPGTWVLSNHDEPRHVTRFGLPDTSWRHPLLPDQGEPDLELGTRRARAAALLLLSLPGSAYLYQGEELGLWQVRDLPDELLQDPTWERSGRTVRGRDGCRVPIPWSGNTPPFGFGAGAPPWLPQPAAWRDFTPVAEARTPGSMLALYRAALRLRRQVRGLASDGFAWMASPPDAIVFARDAGFRCAVNVGPRPLALPGERRTLLRSDGADGGPLGTDAGEWFEVPE
jgi:alpha-glucosidase